MEESFSSEHSGELLGHPLEEFLNSGRVTDESSRHFESTWRDVTDSGFDLEYIII